MDIYKITAVGLIGAVLSVTLKKDCPQIAICITAITCILILGFVLPKLGAVTALLENIDNMMTGENGYVKLVLKIVAVAYISSFGAKLCRDFGESSVGDKIELGGKIIILIVSLPVITGLLDMLGELMP
ncbi:MAG: stage III sporulation protein AD [Clostridiales bacterium]|nr:stage III sporulation protein AD [Clostridiales bacterium]